MTLIQGCITAGVYDITVTLFGSPKFLSKFPIGFDIAIIGGAILNPLIQVRLSWTPLGRGRLPAVVLLYPSGMDRHTAKCLLCPHLDSLATARRWELWHWHQGIPHDRSARVSQGNSMALRYSEWTLAVFFARADVFRFWP